MKKSKIIENIKRRAKRDIEWEGALGSELIKVLLKLQRPYHRTIQVADFAEVTIVGTEGDGDGET